MCNQTLAKTLYKYTTPLVTGNLMGGSQSMKRLLIETMCIRMIIALYIESVRDCESLLLRNILDVFGKQLIRTLQERLQSYYKG